jgi:hypothetical protein
VQLNSPYRLPYEVLYDDGPLMSSGQDVRLRVILRTAATADAVDALDALVGPFVLLATSGAMSGERIDPATSTIEDKQGPVADDRVIEWILQSCSVDERSITVLSQMFLSVQDVCPVARVTLSGPRTSDRMQLAVVHFPESNPFPAAFANPGFAIARDAEVEREVLVRANVAEPALAEVLAAVDGELFSWAAGLLSGAYGVAPVKPDECTAIVDEETEYITPELIWSFTRFSAHPAALDGLVNVFASISRRVARVSQLVIE